MKRLYLIMAMFIASALFITGCDSTESEDTQSVALNSVYSESSSTMAKTNTMADVDSIEITDARFSIRDLKLKTKGNNDSSMFRADPFVLDLNLTGEPQQIGLVDVEPGTYARVEFYIMIATPAIIATLPEDKQIPFNDFVGTSSGDSYSIIIDGVVYKDTVSETFTYKSRLNVNQKYNIEEDLAVSEGEGTVNVSLYISSYDWFRNTSSGGLYDPAMTLTSDQIADIDDNLRQSIRVFRDKNRDGQKD